MNCPICNDYKTQLRRASARGDNENFEAVRALYVQHLAQKHNQITVRPSRETVRWSSGGSVRCES